MPTVTKRGFEKRCLSVIHTLQALQPRVGPVLYARLGDVITRLANTSGLRRPPARGPKQPRKRSAKPEPATKTASK